MFARTALVALMASMAAWMSASAALVTIDQDTTIDAANSYPEPPPGERALHVDIVDGPTGPTTVRLVDGGVIGGFVRIRGGSHLTMTGGGVEAITYVYDEATLTMAGGSILPLIRPLQVAELEGIILVEDSGTVNLRGGVFFPNIMQTDASLVNIYGYDFTVEGNLTGSPGFPRVRGFYPNGSNLDIEIWRHSANARVVLHEVPEPAATQIALGSFLGLIIFRRQMEPVADGSGRNL